MSAIHKNYNLTFENKIFEKRNFKDVNFINRSDKTFTPIYFYLNQILSKDLIEDILIDVNKALLGQPFNDGIEIGSERITLTTDNVEIIDVEGYINNIPTMDFKSILEEYKKFLETPPLSNTRVPHRILLYLGFRGWKK
jgi:hypothetical protein